MVEIPAFAQPGVTVYCLQDGATAFAPTVFPSVDVARRHALLAQAGLAQIETVFNAYLLRFDDGRLHLVDTGYGDLTGDVYGQVALQLASLGVGPDDISSIYFTHLHGDHVGGALLGDGLRYANADVVLQQAEYDYWIRQDSPAQRMLQRYEGRITCLAPHAVIDPLVRCWSLPGHTPGHMGLRIGEKLALIGDIVHSEALQLPEPETASIYDTDESVACAQRIAALNLIADSGLVWSGSHMLGSDKFSTLKRLEAGFERIAR